jgi:hypothetical protein
MADYSQNDSRSARRIVTNLLNNENDNIKLENNLPIADIEGETEDFIEDLNFLKEIGSNMPAVQIGEKRHLIPVSLSYLLELSRFDTTNRRYYRLRRRLNPFWREELYHYFEIIRNEISRGFKSISLSEARTNFQKLATDFLATRIAALRNVRNEEFDFKPIQFLNMFQRKQGSRVQTPGCLFSVSSNSNGLRVFWSGAYRISPNYFSHPTTPVNSILQSGTYVFGVDGGPYGNAIQWDTNAIITLPGTPSVHLNF